jgi:hypothetical protein
VDADRTDVAVRVDPVVGSSEEATRRSEVDGTGRLEALRFAHRRGRLGWRVTAHRGGRTPLEAGRGYLGLLGPVSADPIAPLRIRGKLMRRR